MITYKSENKNMMNNHIFTKQRASTSTYPCYIHTTQLATPQAAPLPQPTAPQLYPNASKIFDNLWLGDKRSSEDENFLRTNNIRVVINCTKELPNIFKPFYINPQHQHSLKDAFLEYARVEIEDNDKPANQEQLFNQLPRLAQFIDQKLNTEKKAILIHCNDGKQRSPTVMAAYIYFKYHQSNGCTMEQVIDHMKKLRPLIFGYGYIYNFKKTLDQFVISYNTQLQQHRSHLQRQPHAPTNIFQLPNISQMRIL